MDDTVSNYSLSLRINKDGVPTRMDLTDSAAILIDEVLEKSHALSVISDDRDELAFTDSRRSLYDTLDMLKRSHDVIKRPFLSTCQMIDDTAREFRIPLEEEMARLDQELGRVLGERRRRDNEEKQKLEDKAAILRLEAKQLELAGKPEEAEAAKRKSDQTRMYADQAVRTSPGLGVSVGWAATEITDPMRVLEFNKNLLTFEVNKKELKKVIKEMEKFHVTITEISIPGLKLEETTSLRKSSRIGTERTINLDVNENLSTTV